MVNSSVREQQCQRCIETVLQRIDRSQISTDRSLIFDAAVTVVAGHGHHFFKSFGWIFLKLTSNLKVILRPGRVSLNDTTAKRTELSRQMPNAAATYRSCIIEGPV